MTQEEFLFEKEKYAVVQEIRSWCKCGSCDPQIDFFLLVKKSDLAALKAVDEGESEYFPFVGDFDVWELDWDNPSLPEVEITLLGAGGTRTMTLAEARVFYEKN